MRKIIFIVLAVVVAALVALFCVREFVTPDINFVRDYSNPLSDNQLKIQRLYAADVDHEAFNKALEAMMNTTEYTEEEIFAAAIASGTPEFFPAFNFSVYRADGETRVEGFIDIEVAEKQKNERFSIKNISLEAVVVGDLTIEDVNTISIYNDDDEPVIKINSTQSATVDISRAKLFRIALDGEDGTVTLRFVYSIQSIGLIPRIALEDQYLEVHAVITSGVGNNLEVQFITEPYSNLEDINPQ